MANLDTAYLNTHVHAANAAGLSAIDTSGLTDGCIGSINPTVPTVLNTDKTLYVLVKAATNTANGTTSLNTLNSDGGTHPGRWIRLNAALLG